jgi:hypothetical protein
LLLLRLLLLLLLRQRLLLLLLLLLLRLLLLLLLLRCLFIPFLLLLNLKLKPAYAHSTSDFLNSTASMVAMVVAANEPRVSLLHTPNP